MVVPKQEKYDSIAFSLVYGCGKDDHDHLISPEERWVAMARQ